MQTDVVKEAYRAAVDGDLKAPPMPQSLEEAGLKPAYVSDLIVKTLYVFGAQSGEVLSQRVLIIYSLLDEELMALQQRRLVEVRGTEGVGRRSYVFDLTSEGPCKGANERSGRSARSRRPGGGHRAAAAGPRRGAPKMGDAIARAAVPEPGRPEGLRGQTAVHTGYPRLHRGVQRPGGSR